MSDTLDWNAKTIAEFRANEGRVGGNFEGAPAQHRSVCLPAVWVQAACRRLPSRSGTLRRVGGERRATSIDSITLGDGGHQGERSPRLGRLHAGSTHQRHGDARPQAGKPPAGGAFSGLR